MINIWDINNVAGSHNIKIVRLIALNTNIGYIFLIIIN